MADTWNAREIPVLLAVLELEEGDHKRVTNFELARMAGISDEDARRSFEALMEDGYVSASKVFKGGYGQWIAVQPRLRGKGRRAVEQWPADGFAALIALLDQRIRDEKEPEARSRYQRVRDAVTGMSREVAAELIADLIRSVPR